MSSRQSGKSVGSWLDIVAGLLATEKKGRRLPVARKLSAERLERRMVLSTASVPATAPANDGSLATYLAQPHPVRLKLNFRMWISRPPSLVTGGRARRDVSVADLSNNNLLNSEARCVLNADVGLWDFLWPKRD